MKAVIPFISHLLMMPEAKRKLARLKPKVKYTLPLGKRESFLKRWWRRKVKQKAQPEVAARHNSDVIHFI